MSYTKNDMKVLLNIMDTKDNTKGKTKINATSVHEIASKIDLALSTIRVSIKKLMKDGYVEYGIANGKVKTYCITLKGLQLLSDVNANIDNYEEDDLDE